MSRLHARPRPPYPSANCLSFSIFRCVTGPTYWRERGGGVEPNHKTARKLDPSINHSILSDADPKISCCASGCLSRLRIFPILDPGSEFFPSRIPGSKTHRIPDPDPQHCPKRLNFSFKKCGYLPWCAGQWDQWRLCCPRPAAQSRQRTSSWGCRTPRKPVSLGITTPTSNVVFARHRFLLSYLLIIK